MRLPGSDASVQAGHHSRQLLACVGSAERTLNRLLLTPIAAAPAFVRKGGDEAVALARNRGDEPRMLVVVLQLHAQISDVAIDHVAFRDEVRTPDAVQYLVPRNDTSSATGEKVEQALLDAAQENR